MLSGVRRPRCALQRFTLRRLRCERLPRVRLAAPQLDDALQMLTELAAQRRVALLRLALLLLTLLLELVDFGFRSAATLLGGAGDALRVVEHSAGEVGRGSLKMEMCNLEKIKFLRKFILKSSKVTANLIL